MSHKPDTCQLTQTGKNVNLIIDGLPVTVPEGTRILEAAKKLNITIPTLCEHPELCKRALCRICVVECDGRGKLAAACANDVWEGVSIVTNNKRLSLIRKTIVEMLLANHPQDCLKCIRNKNCELQSLALKYNIFTCSFENGAEDTKPVIESDTLVRDMDKCVKCARCAEACLEVQTIGAISTARRSHDFEICTPFKQPLEDVSCVFCGGCASVCPVGAIYEHDQTSDVWASLNNNSVKTIAQISPALAEVLHIKAGKLIAAVKLMGFDKVYDASVAANAASAEICNEIKTKQKKPVVSGCAEGVSRFIKNFYPDLTNHLTTAKNIRKTFASLIKSKYAKEAGVDQSCVTSVSFMPCIAQKYASAPDKIDFVLSAKEFLRMIKTAGIIIETLPEEKFDTISVDLPNQDNVVKKETVSGFAQARKFMESIRKGECDADWIEILSCPDGYCK